LYLFAAFRALVDLAKLRWRIEVARLAAQQVDGVLRGQYQFAGAEPFCSCRWPNPDISRV
jgi:hypothetical protein